VRRKALAEKEMEMEMEQRVMVYIQGLRDKGHANPAWRIPGRTQAALTPEF
jgi:hypothetical protein